MEVATTKLQRDHPACHDLGLSHQGIPERMKANATPPIRTCLHRMEHAAHITDSSVVQQVGAALDELEDAYTHPNERTIALETVLQDSSKRRAHVCGTPFYRFLRTCIERRKVRVARRRSPAPP